MHFEQAFRKSPQTVGPHKSVYTENVQVVANAIGQVDRNHNKLLAKVIPGSFLNDLNMVNKVVAYKKWEQINFMGINFTSMDAESINKLHLCIKKEFETLVLMHRVSPGTVVEPKLAIYDSRGEMHGYVMEALSGFSKLDDQKHSKNKNKMRYYLKILVNSVSRFHTILKLPHGDLKPGNLLVKNGSLKILDPLVPINLESKERMFRSDAFQLMTLFEMFQLNPTNELNRLYNEAYRNTDMC